MTVTDDPATLTRPAARARGTDTLATDDDFDITYELELGSAWRALAWLGTCMGYATYVVPVPFPLTRRTMPRTTGRRTARGASRGAS